MMLVPRFLPQIIKHVVLVWRLIFDKRVNLLLRSLVPLAVIYAIVPTDLVKDQVPIIGRFDDFIVFGLAVLFLIKLASISLSQPESLEVGTEPRVVR
jgi:uncharacterized membrane protein YkvA (DUF1232 family)